MKTKSTIISCIRPVLLGCALATTINVAAQVNLVYNGGFENYNSLADKMTEYGDPSPSFPSGWSSPTDGTPDMINDGLHTCDPNYTFPPPNQNAFYPQVCEDDNKYGCQTMRPGSHVYMGLTTAGTNIFFASEFREYLKINLQLLTAGQCYHLTYYVSRADMSSRATEVQALITNQNLDNHNTFAGTIQPPPGSIWLRSEIIYDKQNWTRIDFDFMANGNETYLYLGFFQDENYPVPDMAWPLNCDHTSGTSNSQYLNANNQVAYYYIDDVSLTETAGPTFTPTAGCVFTDANPIISGTFSNANILISGDVTISGTTTFDHCDVRCNDGSTITVPGGNTFIIDNETTIQAGCANMWDGIIVGGNIYMRGSTIMDAHTGIKIANGAQWHLSRDLSNHANYFGRNTVDMEFNIGIAHSGDVIKATTFDKLLPLHDPSQGVNGYGTNCIVVNGSGGVFPITFGGTSFNDACTFAGGQNGIVSSNRNISLDHCMFASHAQTAIDFRGINSSLFSSELTVVSCSFYNCKRHILSQHNTDLTIQISSFNNAQENSVEWNDNHDCSLLVGDASNPALGNTFVGNGWFAVAAHNNSTYQTVENLLAQNILPNNSPTTYTSMVLGSNTVDGNSAGSGFYVGEWTLGQDVSYHEMYIVGNTLNEVYNGIVLYNLKGWRNSGVSPTINLDLNQAYSLAINNAININTQRYSNAVGIKGTNSYGYSIRENQITSDNPFNYVNRGVSLENSPFSKVWGNTISAGVCIGIGSDMLGSDLHCNTFNDYSTGFYLGYTWLRPDFNHTHGSAVIEGYHNLLPFLAYPWNWDIHVDNSDVAKSQWIWNNAAVDLTIQYTGNTGVGSLISSAGGADLCENGFPGLTVFNENVDIQFPNDPIAQWRADYTYEINRRNTGVGVDTVASANIKTIIDIENMLADTQYALAKTALQAFAPSNTVESNYKEVLSVFVDIAFPIWRDPTVQEKARLMTIAEQPARTAGPASDLARGYLTFKYYQNFQDSRPLEDQEINGTATVASPCGLEPASGTWLGLIDKNGNDLGIEGTYVSLDGSFIFDPLQVNYYKALYPTAKYRIYSKQGSRYTVVSSVYKTLDEWLAATPISLNMAGVKVENDTVTGSRLAPPFNPYTSMTDVLGNTYSVGYVEATGGTDYLIEKRDQYDNLLWSRTWDGPVSGEDTATCMYLDASANVYIAGKVFNGNNHDVQILKYDTYGVLIWTGLFADSTGMNNTPTDIFVYEDDQSVHMNCMNGASGFTSRYRYITVSQCLPSGNRYGQTQDSVSVAPQQVVRFYPSPSNGILNVELNGSGGGVLELLNVEGKIVYSQQIAQSSEIVLPATIVDGVYLLKFTGEGEPYYQKLVIYRKE